MLAMTQDRRLKDHTQNIRHYSFAWRRIDHYTYFSVAAGETKYFEPG
jgi:hypothetical protein